MHKPDSQRTNWYAPSPIHVIERRRFVVFLGAALATVACGRSPQALLEPALWSKPDDPALSASASLNKNPRDFGAVGDGAHNDTDAFNAAIRSLSAAGGVISVPDGIYMIDPVVSIQAASNVTLSLSRNAVLRAIPTAAKSSAVVLVSGTVNTKVVGGKIIGERNGHFGTNGEWGMGIRVVGSSNIRIDGVEISDCWGDGIYVGALGVGLESKNVTISSCIGRNNRRQGLSVTGCVGAVIDGCAFTDTNGTAPSAGIDLEPNAGLRVSDVVIRRCTLARNAGYGLLLVGAAVTNAKLEANRCTDNGGPGIYFVRGVNGTTIYRNRIERNATHGVLLEDAHYNDVASNVVRDNSVGKRNGFSNIRLAERSSHNTISDNQFGVTRVNAGIPDVVVTDDCNDNVVQTSVVREASR